MKKSSKNLAVKNIYCNFALALKDKAKRHGGRSSVG